MCVKNTHTKLAFNIHCVIVTLRDECLTGFNIGLLLIGNVLKESYFMIKK